MEEEEKGNAAPTLDQIGSAQRTITITINYTPKPGGAPGDFNMSGPLDNKIVSYGMLMMGIEQIVNLAKPPRVGGQVVPVGAVPFDLHKMPRD